MAYVEERAPRGGSGTVIVAILVIVVLLLVAWMVFGGRGATGGDGGTDIDISVPQAEAPKVDVPENVNVDVRSSGGN